MYKWSLGLGEICDFLQSQIGNILDMLDVDPKVEELYASICRKSSPI